MKTDGAKYLALVKQNSFNWTEEEGFVQCVIERWHVVYWGRMAMNEHGHEFWCVSNTIGLKEPVEFLQVYELNEVLQKVTQCKNAVMKPSGQKKLFWKGPRP